MFAVAFTSANAQKQLGGEHNVEVSFNPFGANPINASVIKYRMFLDDDAALRVTLGLNSTSNSYLVVPGELSAGSRSYRHAHAPDDLFLTNNHSRLDLGVGYEKHFKGTDNLSPYLALGAGISMNSLTLQRERFSALNIEDSELWFLGRRARSRQWGVWSYANEIKSTTINVDLLFGADYYFNDAIYVGFEAGLRFAQTSLASRPPSRQATTTLSTSTSTAVRATRTLLSSSKTP